MPFRYGFYIDPYYIYLVLPALVISILAQIGVKSTFSKYSRQFSRRAVPASEVARQILDQNGLRHVSIQRVAGNLTDHYDPRTNVVSLSDSVYDSPSVASIGVAAHEVGHAIQHATGYVPIKIRNAIVPVANIGSTLSIPLAILGLFMGLPILVDIGIILFASVTLFQLVTLPVEFNASSRAIKSIEAGHMLEGEEVSGAKKVLRAAAMTYVAATLTAIANLARIILLFGNRNRR
jgi:Zn-dependent membrane protease YugP